MSEICIREYSVSHFPLTFDMENYLEPDRPAWYHQKVRE